MDSDSASDSGKAQRSQTMILLGSPSSSNSSSASRKGTNLQRTPSGSSLASHSNSTERVAVINSKSTAAFPHTDTLPIRVAVPPRPVRHWEYLEHEERVSKVLHRRDQANTYSVLLDNGRRVNRSVELISSTPQGKQALSDFHATIEIEGQRSQGSSSGVSGTPDESMDSESEGSIDFALPVSKRSKRSRLMFTRGDVHRQSGSRSSMSDIDKELESSEGDHSYSLKAHGVLTRKTARSTRPSRSERLSRQPRKSYNYGNVLDDDGGGDDDDDDSDGVIGMRQSKRKRRDMAPIRRSERTHQRDIADMRERGEDEIEEVEAHHVEPKVFGAREAFRRLSKDDEFRKRHCMTCGTCGQMGDNSDRGDLIFCQGCTMSYHRGCIGSRTSRDHLVTKVGNEDFVLQCRRCVELVRQKDKTAPRQGRCAACKKPGAASRAFRTRKTPLQEQKDREQNDGQDPVQTVARHLLNTAGNVLFRCQQCYQAFHLHHLEPKQENPLEGDDPTQKAANRFSEYSRTWVCHVCESRPMPPLPNTQKASIGGLIAWRPTQDADYRGGQVVDEVEEDCKEYLVKWNNMSHYSCKWMPGPWVWGSTNAAMRKAFANRDNGRNLPTMRTEDAIPEDWLRIDIIFSVKYSNLVQAQIEEVDVARVKEVARVFAKFKGLTYEEAVWTDPPDIEETERYEDFRTAYIEFVRGKYIRPPAQKKLNNELQRLRPAGDEDRRSVFAARIMLKAQPPDLLTGDLMDYQLEGVNWLLYQWQLERNAILADEMGLGKTIQVIAFLAALKENHGCWPALIVVPNATCANWRREIQKWAPRMRVVTYFGSERAKTLAMAHELFGDREKSVKPSPADLRCHIVVTSYETASDPSCMPFFRKIAWQVMIIDEGQRLKNDKTILYANLSSVKAPFRLLLTGTPLQNNQRELFNLLHFIDRDKDAAKLEEEYAVLTAQLVKQLHEMIRPYFLRRTKAQVLTFLPPMGQVIVPITMSTLQRELYKNILGRNAQLLKAILSKGKGEKTSTISGLKNVLVQLRKCLCHPFVYNIEVEERTDNAAVSHRRLVAASSKLTLLEMMLPKLHERGHRVLIFSQFLGMLTMMEDFLDGIELPHLRLDGSQSSLEKQKIIDRFNAPDSPIFTMLLSTRAGGVGINLATADTVIILDPDFNPHQDVQAIARAHRIGQKKKVLVFKLMTRDSAEERIMQVGKHKMALDHAIVDQMEADDTDDVNLESILAFGAQALFNDEAKDIVYDEASVEKLLDRSQVEDTKLGEGSGGDASQENAFAFARIWQNDKGALGEMEALPDADRPVDPGVWDGILAARAREAEAERLKREAVMGRGKRSRNVVHYGQGQMNAADKDADAEADVDADSDTDFAARSSSDESSSDEASAAEATVEDFDIVGGTEVMLSQAADSVPTVRLPKARTRPASPVRAFARVQVENPTWSQAKPDSLPCLACRNCFGPHLLGSCPLKLAGVEYCNLCGLAHFGYQRNCPHLKSETQIGIMLNELKASPEDPEIVRKAVERLKKIRSAIVFAKKRAAAKVLENQKQTSMAPSSNSPAPPASSAPAPTAPLATWPLPSLATFASFHENARWPLPQATAPIPPYQTSGVSNMTTFPALPSNLPSHPGLRLNK